MISSTTAAAAGLLDGIAGAGSTSVDRARTMQPAAHRRRVGAQTWCTRQSLHSMRPADAATAPDAPCTPDAPAQPAPTTPGPQPCGRAPALGVPIPAALHEGGQLWRAVLGDGQPVAVLGGEADDLNRGEGGKP